ncbi:hypothetical protein [Thalassolituus sp.]|mgnify:CR=1 FL=1|jgi:hypothetical protein|uniref:hypothetical protein n=1 Tax=Thalassolituus sp. TaxID=2030822 RepID=UPI002A829F2B|nr:hypothetical protein [Thalassolituus sp.]|tara:strand:+ start:2209 stop:2592 length:384 start_codon:yes stop_codon:yes gene_type:complete
MDKIVFDLTMILMFILFFSGIFIWTGMASLAGYFGKNYDHILLKSPHFSPEEQANYREFPLYLHKTIIYMTYFSYPRITRKRFKNTAAPEIELFPKIASYTITTTGPISVALLIVLIGLVAYLYSQI